MDVVKYFKNHWILVVIVAVILIANKTNLTNFLSNNVWIGLEAIFTIATFIISAFVFLAQRKDLIYQNTTTELRNEMYALLERFNKTIARNINEPIHQRERINIYPEDTDVEHFIDIAKRLIKHGNQSIVNEFKIHEMTELMLFHIKKSPHPKNNHYTDILSFFKPYEPPPNRP